MTLRLPAILVASAIGALPAAAGDRGLLNVLARDLPRVAAAERAAAAGAGGSDAVESQYGAARDLEEALRLVVPVSPSCRLLLAAARSLARGEILQAEGVDRPDPGVTRHGLRQTSLAQRQIELSRARCRPTAAAARSARLPELERPRSGEIFFGVIGSRAPSGASSAYVRVNQRRSRVAVHRGRLAFRPRLQPGRYDIRVDYFDARNRGVGSALSRAVWLLPSSAARHAAPTRPDGALSRRLSSLARSFPGHSAMWLHDLTTGRTAEWNADARFPAASTVKLGVLIAALRRFGPRPERSRVAYDLEALTGWSSNLASNRLLGEIGGSETAGAQIAQRVLHRLGARSSTFTGDYRIGTAAARIRANEPPLISSRVTTARDLGRILFQLHAAAVGSRRALAATGLTRHEARVALALLLSYEPTRDNAGLFQPALGRRFPLAQKNGWFSSVRHTAAVLYASDGPRIAVLLTYRPGITRVEAAALGARFIRIVRGT